jgi:hypothetical protein
VKVYLALGFILVVVLSMFCVEYSEAKSYGTIYIHSDGNIAPSSVPIQREGDTYHLLDDLYNSPIVLERNNIIFDGEGYTLEGAAQAIALNITCSNVTVRNLQVWNWEAGVLGAYNNVTIQNCNLTGNGKGIGIYADNYRVTGNYIAQNKWGIRAQGNNIVITENQLVGNSIGIWISSFQGNYNQNTIAFNAFKTNGQIAIETDMGGDFRVHHNNFIIPLTQGPIVQTAYLVVPGDETQVVMPSWDNGVEGNYWSNYAAKYPNASEVGATGVYDLAYVINVAPNLTDRYPLVRKVDVSEVVLPMPIPSSQPSLAPSPSLTPTQTPSVSPNTIPSSSPTPSPQQQNAGFPSELYAPAGLAVIIISGIVVALFLRKRIGGKA